VSSHRLAFSVDQGIARLTLDNAEGRNAIDLQFAEAFADCAKRCDDDAVRVVLMRANGNFFSVGGNLADFVAHADNAERHVHDMARMFHLGVERLHNGPAPVVLALGGMAAGGGFSLVCGADLVIAARSARLTSAYTRTGLTPDGGLTYFLARIVGTRKAFEIMALNRVMDAQEAWRLGIVNDIVDDDALEHAVEIIAHQLAQTPSSALRRLKLLLRQGDSAPLSQQLEREAVSIAQQAGHPQTMERLRNFLSPR
jgi:2-(1,2-epoxy-1,2-dihydrophenyl)acetyl-CoA isomerase